MAENTNPTQTTNVYTQQRLPPELAQYYKNMASSAQDVAATPYQQYGGQRIADFSQPERAAMQGITQMGTSGGPWQMQQAGNAMNQAYGMAQNAGGQGYGDM